MLKVRYQPLCPGDSGMTQNLDELNIDKNQLAMDIARDIDDQIVQDLHYIKTTFKQRFKMENYLYRSFSSCNVPDYDEWLSEQFPNQTNEDIH